MVPDAAPDSTKEEALEFLQRVKLIISQRHQKSEPMDMTKLSESQRVLFNEVELAKVEDDIHEEIEMEKEEFETCINYYMSMNSEKNYSECTLRGFVEEYYMSL